VTFDEWECSAPTHLTRDRLWRMRVYRLVTYLASVARLDAQAIADDPIGRLVAPQLYASVGSIRANLAEGYSRSSGRERVRFFEYALGSARETLEWYSHSESFLPASELRDRLDVTNQIIRILLSIIPKERDRTIRPSADFKSAKR
jgi:four helix bundle protein